MVFICFTVDKREAVSFKDEQLTEPGEQIQKSVQRI